MINFSEEDLTVSSLQIYRTIAKLGNQFSFYSDKGFWALKTSIKNPYFNFLLIKNEKHLSLESAVNFFDPFPFECTFDSTNQFLIKQCKTFGLIFAESTLRMSLNLLDALIKIPINTNASTQQVKSETEMRQWINITALSFRLSTSYIKDFFYPIFLSSHKNFKFSLCFYNGMPSAASSLFIRPPYSTIFSLATRPQFRKKGLASQLLQEELSFIKSIGILHCTVQAALLGKNIYKKLGFQATQELTTYIFLPHTNNLETIYI